MDWNDLIHKRISVLITGKNNRKETYNGIVQSINGNFITMSSLPSLTFEIETFLIRTDIIESVWIYKKVSPNE